MTDENTNLDPIDNFRAKLLLLIKSNPPTKNFMMKKRVKQQQSIELVENKIEIKVPQSYHISDLMAQKKDFIRKILIYQQKINTNLIFQFNYHGIKDIFAKFFFESLLELREFTLTFSNITYIGDSELEIIGATLNRKLNYLQKLRIQCSSSRITDKGLKIFGIELTKTKSQLEEISLNFSRCPHVTDKGVKILTSKLCRRLPNLKNITLDFHLAKITGKSIESIGYEVGNQESRIEQLKLNFERCEELADKNLEIFLLRLAKSQNSLRKFSINCWDCLNITENGFLNFAKTLIKNFQKLTSLNFKFNGCIQITKKSVEEFGLVMNEYGRNIQNLTLFFYGCDEITEEAKNKFIANVSFVPFLKLKW